MSTSITSTGLTFPSGETQTFATGVKSVQSVYTTPAGTLTGDYGVNRAINVTISAVNTAKSIIFSSEIGREFGGSSLELLSYKFINSTTVQICPTNKKTFYYVRFQVVEFN